MHFLKSGGCFSPWIFGYLDPWLRMQVEMVAPRRCLFLSGSVDLWIHCYQQRICYLTICDLTICNLTALTLPLLPCCHYLTLVAPRRCLFLSKSTDLWIHCYQQKICYLTICDFTICNLTALNLPLLPFCHYHSVVAPWRCLISEQVYGSIAINSGSVTLPLVP